MAVSGVAGAVIVLVSGVGGAAGVAGVAGAGVVGVAGVAGAGVAGAGVVVSCARNGAAHIPAVKASTAQLNARKLIAFCFIIFEFPLRRSEH